MSRKLQILLFLGYPNNGGNLYIISDNVHYTEEEINARLVPHHDILDHEEYNYLKNVEFTLDIIINKGIEYDLILQFHKDAQHDDLVADDDFFLMASAVYWAEYYDLSKEMISEMYMYLASIDEDRAYEETSIAIWELLTNYGIDEGISDLNINEYPLAKKLLHYTDLVYDSALNIDNFDDSKINDDIKFTLGKDGKYYSNEIYIDTIFTEKEYELELPDGIYLSHGGSIVMGQEPFRLISDEYHQIDELRFIIHLEHIEYFYQYKADPDKQGIINYGQGNIIYKSYQDFAGLTVYNHPVEKTITIHHDIDTKEDDTDDDEDNNPDDKTDNSENDDSGSSNKDDNDKNDENDELIPDNDKDDNTITQPPIIEDYKEIEEQVIYPNTNDKLYVCVGINLVSWFVILFSKLSKTNRYITN